MSLDSDIDYPQCVFCEVAYGSPECQECPEYEGDLKAIGRMFGSEISSVIPRLLVGYSVFHLADVGDPLVVAWRPTYSQP